MEVDTVVVNENERRKVDARAVMTATDSQMGHDPVGAANNSPARGLVAAHCGARPW